MSTVYSAVIMIKKSIHHKTDEHRTILCLHARDADICVHELKRYYERIDDLYGRRIYISTEHIYRQKHRYRSSITHKIWSEEQIWSTLNGMNCDDIIRTFLRVTDRDKSYFERLCCCIDWRTAYSSGQ